VPKLTTHILDTSIGKPAQGVQIELFKVESSGSKHIFTTTTNSDGRTDVPMLAGEDFVKGTYELHFHVESYFAESQPHSSEVAFLGIVPIRFSITSDTSAYHVPLLVTPWSYSNDC